MFHRVEEPLSRHNRELIHSLTTNHKIYTNPARAIVGASSGRPHTSESDVWIREIREIRGQNNNDLIVWYRIEKCYQHELPWMDHKLSWMLLFTGIYGAPVKPCVTPISKMFSFTLNDFNLTQRRREREVGESLRPRCRPCRRCERASVATTAGLSA